MSFGANLIQIHRSLGELASRLNDLETAASGGVSDDQISKVVGPQIDAL